MQPKKIEDPGQARYWSIQPLKEQESTIRVNQFVDFKSPAHYEKPRIEISIFWINNDDEYMAFLGALVKAHLQWADWDEDTGKGT